MVLEGHQPDGLIEAKMRRTRRRNSPPAPRLKDPLNNFQEKLWDSPSASPHSREFPLLPSGSYAISIIALTVAVLRASSTSTM